MTIGVPSIVPSIAPSVAIGWRLSSVSGWGVYGTNLALELVKAGRTPILYLPPHLLDLDAGEAAALAPVLSRMTQLSELIAKGTLDALELDAPVLHALRNDFMPGLAEAPARGRGNLGIIFFEDTAFSDDGLARARSYDRIVTGSSWNDELARAAGLGNVVKVFQGVDLDRFKPAPRANRYRDRFVVFSGGKLEYRKAQDVVIAAFRAFHARHPEALLMLAWSNQWPASVETIARSRHVTGSPAILADGGLDLIPWLAANGIPADAVLDLGAPPNRDMPAHLAAADCAVFPNRCEPGTNLVAMEAMAMGLPVALAANTGQRDLIGDGNAYALDRQGPVTPHDPHAGTEGWGEADPEEVLAALEEIHADREEAKRRGAAAAAFMRNFSWGEQVARLLAEVDGVAADG